MNSLKMKGNKRSKMQNTRLKKLNKVITMMNFGQNKQKR